MKKNLIRLTAALLTLLMLVPCLFACKKDEEIEELGDAVVTVPEGDEESEQVKNLPTQQDFGGVEIVILHDITQDNVRYFAPVEDDGLKSDAVNIALANRNALIESFYNVKFKIEALGKYELPEKLGTASQAQLYRADMCYSIAGNAMNKGIPLGLFTDLNTLDNLKLDASYYDQRIQEEYNIEGKLFCIEGDFTVQDEMRTQVVGINRTLYKDYGYEDSYGSPYELVRDNKWTIATMMEMAKGRSDYNGNAADMTKNSQWSIITEGVFPYVLYLGSGNKILETNNGTWTTAYSDQSKIEILDNILTYAVENIFKNEEVLTADNISISGGQHKLANSQGVYFADAKIMFANGQTLFRTSTLSDFISYRDMEDTFGILPVPMWEENQDGGYFSWCSSEAHCPLFIPRYGMNDRLDMVSKIVEGYAYFSKYSSNSAVQTVLEAFYENMTYAKLCRTADDYAMLEIIFGNKTFDIDYALNISQTAWRSKQPKVVESYTVTTVITNGTSDMTNPDPEANKMTKFLSDMHKAYSN